MITVVIADDEPVARAGLRDLLEAVDWVRCVGEAPNGPAAVEMIERLRPDAVFLDIQMPGLLGTEVLGRITHRPRVVFTTAYAQHAVTAFELGALDYLLKPFGKDRLHKALDRLRAATEESPAHFALDRYRDAAAPGPIRRVFVRSAGAVIPIPVERISWFEARGDYVAAHVGAARHLLSLSLNRLEGRLDPARFRRIHRTHIVNLDHVRAFRRLAKDRVVATLSDGTELPVSRPRVQELRDLVS